jgi:hypothetical protein
MHWSQRTLYFALAFTLGGCSSVDFDSFRAPSVTQALRLPEFSTPRAEAPVRPITAEDLVNADGSCPSPTVQTASAEPGDGGTAAAPATPGGIGLEMAECEVVRRAGQPERVEIGTSERGERSVAMTYTRGARPGVYKFTSGRLVAMERAGEPAPAAKPSRAAPKRKVANRPAEPKPAAARPAPAPARAPAPASSAAAPWPSQPAQSGGAAAPWPSQQQSAPPAGAWPAPR